MAKFFAGRRGPSCGWTRPSRLLAGVAEDGFAEEVGSAEEMEEWGRLRPTPGTM